jgi:dipeptide transport system substrate-binding protein
MQFAGQIVTAIASIAATGAVRSAFGGILATLLFATSVHAAAVGNLESKTFVYCSEGSPTTFNPQLGTDGPTFNASSRAVYNRLVDFERGGTKVVPSLAEKWQVSKDGKIVTFQLRKNVKFQSTDYFKPTRPFGADDVLFTFNRMLKPDHPFHKVSGGVYEYFNSMEMDKLIKSIDKIDEFTVKFVLERPEAPFLANLAMDFASILSSEYADQLLKAKTLELIDQRPIGTGPFAWKSYRKDSEIRYEAHPEYFEGRAAIGKLVFAITKDANVRMQKLRTGECHLVAEPPPADIQKLRVTPGFQVAEREGLNVSYLAFNTKKAPFNKLEVRQAINHALNRTSYMDAIYLGSAIVAKNPIPPSMWSFNGKVTDYNYDVTKAKELLSKAGYAKGFETTLWYLPISRGYNPNGKKMGEMMQADLAKIGIRANLVSYDWGTYLAKARVGEHDMIMGGWIGDNGDPDNFLAMLLGCAAVESGSNYARWCFPAFENLIQKAKVTSDQKSRTKLYEEAQLIAKKEAPWVTIAHAKAFRAMSSKVTGYKMSPFGTDAFYGVDLK